MGEAFWGDGVPAYLKEPVNPTEMPQTLPPLTILPQYPPGTGEDFQFQVVLHRQSLEEKFGLVHKTGPYGVLVVAKPPEKNLAAKHNWAMRHYPANSMAYASQFMENDCIISVNGSVDKDVIRETLRSELEVTIVIQRKTR
eukprot:gnl/MRDRNA2_/MRDRNA2_17910_c0_seq1.p1 gnl/MRDRNA2_/MRDRNA2_17910_c0~~gnl/MRDRNA2_/MRDRNA2_17910_c0_seq1.p1  ORF type:complete len:141 (-),score=23.74 gnl/MRDRNA2_/MRDRNA2_17910_c0_seq1:27-449(-)